MNKLNEHLLDAPSIGTDRCVVCGAYATNHHHVIAKGMGGSKLAKRIPTVLLCGMGNTGGCHGKAHSGRLFLDYRDGCWWFFESNESITLYEALDSDGWRRCIG